jgi:hypothetical protein
MLVNPVTVTGMTKETSRRDSLEAQVTAVPAVPAVPAGTTVFSDGSTFDYENGYQSNGAPVATRDRTESPTIAKSQTIFNSGLVWKLVGWVLVLAAITFALFVAVLNMQKDENINVIKAAINESGQAEVVQSVDGGLILKDSKGTEFKCDVSMISNGGDPVGHVFCAEGQPATYSIPLRRDPANILYMAPLEEIEEFEKLEK